MSAEVPPFRAIPSPRVPGIEPRIAVEIPDALEVVYRAARAVAVESAKLPGGVTRVLGAEHDLKRLAGALDAARAPEAQLFWNFLEPVTTLRAGPMVFSLERPLIMGILNLTDDSFSGDGVGGDLSSALRRAEHLRAEGAAIIDIGAESARADRPVRDEVEEAEVLGRAVSALVADGHTVSADTYTGPVARAAASAGAAFINDISGLTRDDAAAEAAAEAGCGYILNYSYSVPKRRPASTPIYEDVVAETLAWMFARVRHLRRLGLPREAIVVDPGIAFGKSHDEDIQVIRRLGEFTSLGLPVMLAHSRKNFLGSLTGHAPAERDLETHAATVLAYERGARLFRVHDVAGTRRALEVAAAIAHGSPGDFAPDEGSWPWRAGVSAEHMTRGATDKDAPAGQRW